MLQLELEKRVTTPAGPIVLNYNAVFASGRCTAIAGVSGAGKTTLLKMIAGLLRPECGFICSGERGEDVWFDSNRGIDLSPGKRRIGYVSQGESLFSHMTVEQNIAYGCEDRDYLEFLLRITGLGSLKNSLPNRLSGGQQQRVALCRALSHKPEYLLLDEPFSALDRTSRLSLQSQVVRLRKRVGLTVLLVSHDEQEIDRLADKKVLIGSECPYDKPRFRLVAGGV